MMHMAYKIAIQTINNIVKLLDKIKIKHVNNYPFMKTNHIEWYLKYKITQDITTSNQNSM